MSKTDKIREEIRSLIVEKGEFHKSDLTAKFPTHLPLIGYALKQAVTNGEILKRGETRGARYVAAPAFGAEGNLIRKTYERGKQREEEIFFELQDEFLSKYVLSDNAKQITSYAFTEMVNNAIDHSESDTIEVQMWVHNDDLHFTVRDHGVGVFQHVKEDCDLPDERAALAELTKGKVTTAPMWHSGEGIFFTSRAADIYRLSSGKLTMQRINAKESELEVIERLDSIDGTLVEFSVALNTPRRLAKDVFGQFESKPEEKDFGRTEIEVNLFGRGDVHVSRSQAKRLMEGLGKFKIVTLNFENIPFIGQGFADQIFRIFLREHPNTHIVVKNAVPDVQFMIDRVRKE